MEPLTTEDQLGAAAVSGLDAHLEWIATELLLVWIQ
jgi:hypothetical protein